MRPVIAYFFKKLFSIPSIKHTYYGFYKRVFRPYNLFKGLRKNIFFRNGIRLQLDLEDWIPQHLYFLGEYEEKELRFIENFLDEGDVFIDVGANIGLFSLVAAEAVGVSGKVYAFEPFQKNYDALMTNLSLNLVNNVTPEKQAISDEEGELILYLDESENNPGMVSRFGGSHTLTENVIATTLDAYLADKQLSPRLIKIDIEGGELMALKGMEKTLKEVRPTLLVEIIQNATLSAFTGKDLSEEYLKSLGYEKYFLDKEGTIITQKETGDRSHNYVFSRIRYS
jgi:FkbM family methyltransferase